MRRGRPLPSVALSLALAVAAGSCRSGPDEGAEPEASQPRPRGESEDELSLEMFRRLIAEGALRPVPIEQGEGFPSDVGAMEGDLFEQAAAAVGEHEAKRLAQVGAPPQPAPESTVAPPAPPPESQSENPYLVFGERIQVYPSGLIMKPYPLRVGTGEKLLKLLQVYGSFPIWQPGGEPQTLSQVRLELESKWDLELFSDLRAAAETAEGKPVGVADWLIVTTGPEMLKEVESFINIFAAGVPQIEIEAKIVEVIVSDSMDLGVTPINSTTPIFGFPDGTFVDSFNYNLPNSAGGLGSFLALGGVQDGVAINAILQALSTYENVSIISRPKIAVREGGKAEILNTQKIPNLNISNVSTDGKYSGSVAYEEVGIKLFVIPRVVGTQTVALSIDIEASAQTGSAVTFTPSVGPPVSNPIISRRAAKTVVYLEPGQAVILGGLITERIVDTENKVPLLGDIPLLGYFFKSTFKRKEQANVLFFIRPRILQGADVNREF